MNDLLDNEFIAVVVALFIGLFNNEGLNIAIIVLGFSVTIFKSLISIFDIQKKSILLMQVSIKERKIAREVKNLKTTTLPTNDLIKIIDNYYTDNQMQDIFKELQFLTCHDIMTEDKDKLEAAVDLNGNYIKNVLAKIFEKSYIIVNEFYILSG